MTTITIVAETWQRHFQGALPDDSFLRQWKRFSEDEIDAALSITSRWLKRRLELGNDISTFACACYASRVMQNIHRDNLELAQLQQDRPVCGERAQ